MTGGKRDIFYAKRTMIPTPTYSEENLMGTSQKDVFSKLFSDRNIMLFDQLDNNIACVVISQLMFLEAADPSKDITIFINSPGGVVSAGLAIYDAIKRLKCDVSTVCTGEAASMGAFLLAAGTKGKRYATPSSEIMIHQPLGGAQGQATEIQIVAEHILRTKKKLNTMLSELTGQPYEKICADTERDNWLTPEEAVKYGIIDGVR